MGTIFDARKNLADARERIKSFINGFVVAMGGKHPEIAEINIDAMFDAIDEGALDSLINV